MKIVIPGGSGQVGRLLARAFVRGGHEVTVLARTRFDAPWYVEKWDARKLGTWCEFIDGADVVINLAGRSVNCRYTPANRREIMDSRVLSTRVIGEAISKSTNPPAVWLQASTATIYAHRYDAPNDEETGIIGGSEPDVPDTWRFSIDVAKAWEKELDDAPTPRTRKVKLRSAMTMSPDRGGIFAVLRGLALVGLGGTAGDGRQYVSWIHDEDFIRAVKHLMENQSAQGAYNLAAPNPLPYAEFMRALRLACGMPIGLPATRWMLEIGTFVMRTETELVLKSRRVTPGRLLKEGFRFRFPTWPEAAGDLCERWREPKPDSSTTNAVSTDGLL